jgi:hypothetical protein
METKMRKLWNWFAFGALLCCSPAYAQTKVTGGLSPIDVLVIKDQIRETWAQYTLMHDGDGVEDRTSQWAARTFTPDGVFKVYANDGLKLREYHGVKEIGEFAVSSYAPWKQRHGKHLPIIIAYDEVTPTSAKTRTVLTDISIVRSTVKGMPDTAPGSTAPGVPSRAGSGVYHDTWKKQGDLWLKSESILYSANSGCFPSDLRLTGCPIGLHETKPPPTR